ncbi:MAG: 8-amino-7-oxononanoate synthase [Chitinivibrionales bacterium]
MNDSPIYDRINKSLSDKKRANLFRTVAKPLTTPVIDVSTNSYLSLHANPEVAQAARALTRDQFYGNCASRIISSNSPLYDELESEIASWENTESALVFNSGYVANLGIITSLCNRDTEIFSDKLNHASIIDGIQLSGGIMTRYLHCNLTDLEKKLAASTRKDKIIVTDTVFSMDGDCAPLADICELAAKYCCMVMVDEAHATGVFGKTGSGLVEQCGLEHSVDIRMGTLSKSIAGLGGYFAGSQMLHDYFVNTSRSLIYSTGLPHAALAHDLAALRYIRARPEMGKQLLEKSSSFGISLRELGFSTLNSTTHIVPCLFGDEKAALSASEFCLRNGIKVPAIRPPTVPPHSARLRFSMQADLSKENLEYIIGILGKIKNAK